MSSHVVWLPPWVWLLCTRLPVLQGTRALVWVQRGQLLLLHPSVGCQWELLCLPPGNFLPCLGIGMGSRCLPWALSRCTQSPREEAPGCAVCPRPACSPVALLHGDQAGACLELTEALCGESLQSGLPSASHWRLVPGP